MNDIKKVIDQIERSLNESLKLLQELDTDNFDTNYSKAVEKMKKAEELKKVIPDGNTLEGFELSKKKINFLTKQISERYDNIIEKYRNDLLYVSGELKKLRNKKKISVYSGGIR